MTTVFTANINEDVKKRFELALQLTGEHHDHVIESLLKMYITTAFSNAATAYSAEVKTETVDPNYAKALHKIGQWAAKPMLIPSKILRAYLLLKESHEYVTYPQLMQRCSDPINYPDEYSKTFANNFAQMKFDSEKSHGKIFEVNANGVVTLWDQIKETVKMNEKKLTRGYSTAVGYVNSNNQRNMGRTELRGTDHEQYLYKMHCDNCGHVYHANGSDIHLKKCPHCQGGANTSSK